MKVDQPSANGQLLGGRYRLLEQVGRGATAAVYRGFDETLGRDVALKVFARECGDTERLGRQDAEIRILASLTHPALVTLFDAGTDPEAVLSFVVMEFISGPDLRRQLREGTLMPEDIAGVGAELASALSYIHRRGVIHRDIKPGNILLYQSAHGAADRLWHAKLADFGIARVMEDSRLTGTGRTVGTAAYLSPEQALGGELSGASDVYSLGLVLLECLTRHVEFPGAPIESGIARLNRDPAIPTTVSLGWASLLRRMTARFPADRISAAKAAVALRDLSVLPATKTSAISTAPNLDSTVLRPVATNIPNPVQPPHPGYAPGARSPRQPVSRNRRRRVVAGICLAAVLITGATAASPGGGKRTDQPVEATTLAVAAQTNPLDFHLDQLRAAIDPSEPLRAILNRIRLAIAADDMQSALTYLRELEEDAEDEALRTGMTFEKYRSITAASRLVKSDLQVLISTGADPTIEAAPDGTRTTPAPVLAADPATSTNNAEPGPVLEEARRQVDETAPQQADPLDVPAKAGRNQSKDAGNAAGKSDNAPGHNKP
ncbi:serine/threonine-protein kinase [Arthrobacter ulcerisalmonis]|uniref:serine/threonine-protein kinase n=1 Tax=Arthrobacter ulcerisalmonis TaxID=2483813 RepID=UPI001356B50B|nr:serine/threonine-protein kinase [Arthrobacter ulcerisalmonis]